MHSKRTRLWRTYRIRSPVASVAAGRAHLCCTPRLLRDARGRPPVTRSRVTGRAPPSTRAMRAAPLPMLATLLGLLVGDAEALTVAVTHAAGRMGVSVVGQLREQWQSASDAPLQIVAIVRSEEEEDRLRLDLCGAVLRNGEMRPLLDLQDDLNIRVAVVPDDLHESDGLSKAFEGAEVRPSLPRLC